VLTGATCEHHYVVQVRLKGDKGLQLVLGSTSADVLHLLRLMLELSRMREMSVAEQRYPGRLLTEALSTRPLMA
jgi:hypothetical protein